MKSLLIFLILCVVIVGLFANDFNPRSITLYDTSNSPLPSNTINCIAVDVALNKWIGTSNGLVKYDGTNWTIYNTSNSGITGNNITQITIDANGLLWIYPSDGNLVSFNGTQWTTHGVMTGLYSLTADPLGNVWAGKSSLLSEFTHGGWLNFTTANSGVPHSNINSIVFDFLGYKWLGTESAGVVRFDGTNWIPYNQTNTLQPINSLLSLYYDLQNNLWLGTSNHALIKFDGTNWSAYQSSNSPILNDASISCISQGNAQAIWFGTTTQGLIKRTGTQWVVYSTADSTFPANEIKSLVVDNLDVKWVGTNIGLVKLDNIVGNDPNDPYVYLPDSFIHLKCYPNPFNPSTTISYDLPGTQAVILEIYNVKGQFICNLLNEIQSVGHHQISWDGLDKDRNSVPSGMYLCNLRTGKNNLTKKILLLK